MYDSDADESLSLNELLVLLQELGHKITALPAVRICILPPDLQGVLTNKPLRKCNRLPK